MNNLTLAQVEEYQRRKAMLKTGAEFKELAREIRDCHGLTDLEALSIFNGVTSLLEVARHEIKQSKEEVERLKEENEHFRINQEVQQSWDFHMIESQILMGEEIERLQGQLQDALTVISNALTDVMDMLAVSEMERRNMELCPQCNMLSLHDELQAAIDRIQEEGTTDGISKG